MAEGPRKIDAQRYDAIHRALLTGLLSNIGQKTDPHEYTGARGKKFNIFPGSSLFKKEPRWVMAAEIVETTRTYARTNAAIDPAWVERLAEHLVKRSYSDPHWNSATAHVVAYEKVTLYGLVLVPQRPVHYGPIDPKVSREIFIRSALVQGDWRTDAPFFRHNAKLIDEVQTLEAKSRSRDVLVDEQVRFDFYDARVPAGIHNGPAFDKWRREAERHNPRILFMTRRDLMRHAANDVTAQLFPDHITLGGVSLPLEYHFEVGHEMDGVTVSLPLPALAQLPTEPFEWLVPGLLKEKIAALIKSLPKELRVNFVPAPDYAEQAAKGLRPYEGSLTEALALHLGKLKGVRIHQGAFDLSALADHLHMNFKVTDQQGKVLALGRDLEGIRKQLGLEVRATFSRLEHPLYNREEITHWDFGDLPEAVTVQRHGMTLTAYPALVDTSTEPAAAKGPASAKVGQALPPAAARRAASPAEARPAISFSNPNLIVEGRKSGSRIPNLKSEMAIPQSGVALRLFESRDAAAAAHTAGLRRLFMLHLRDEIRYLASTLPNLQQMCLHYAPLGPCEQLKSDIIGETVNRAFLYDSNVRTAMEFELRKTAGRRHRLLEVGREVATLAGSILAAYHQVTLSLDKPMIPAFAPTLQDVRGQLAELMPKDFLTSTPDEWLVHFPRFLKAISTRLDKLAATGHTRDQQRMAEYQQFHSLYAAQLRRNREQNLHDPALEQFRWLLEEFRVSLFAQELKTSVPVSAKRLEKHWESVRR